MEVSGCFHQGSSRICRLWYVGAGFGVLFVGLTYMVCERNETHHCCHRPKIAAGIVFMVFSEGHRFASAVYWVVVTGTTVGFGDISAGDTTGGRIFSIFYLVVSHPYKYTSRTCFVTSTGELYCIQ